MGGRARRLCILCMASGFTRPKALNTFAGTKGHRSTISHPVLGRHERLEIEWPAHTVSGLDESTKPRRKSLVRKYRIESNRRPASETDVCSVVCYPARI